MRNSLVTNGSHNCASRLSNPDWLLIRDDHRTFLDALIFNFPLNTRSNTHTQEAALGLSRSVFQSESGELPAQCVVTILCVNTPVPQMQDCYGKHVKGNNEEEAQDRLRPHCPAEQSRFLERQKNGSAPRLPPGFCRLCGRDLGQALLSRCLRSGSKFLHRHLVTGRCQSGPDEFGPTSQPEP